MTTGNPALDELLGRAIVDFGATLHAPLVLIGDQLGLYKAMAESGPLTSSQLAERTGTRERYVREWLGSQSAGGYVTYHPAEGRYSLTEEQKLCLADEGSPCFLPGAFQVAVAAAKAEPKIREAFRSGDGVGWHEHDDGVFCGTERFFRPGYAANLVSSWIPALQGVKEQLERGARVADVGCGHGASTILMAQAFPRSKFFGFDYHRPSVEYAEKAAKRAGVQSTASFATASAKEFPIGEKFDFVTFFDCLHDLGDPVGAARHVRDALTEGGTWMIVEPFAGDSLTDNLNPIGRAYYSASTLICTPASLSQEVGLALGAQAGEAKIEEVVKKAGFKHFRRASETPFNLVFEVR